MGALPRSGSPNIIRDDQLTVVIETDRHITIFEFTEKFNSFKTIVSEDIKRLGFVKKVTISIRHDLKEIHLTQHNALISAIHF